MSAHLHNQAIQITQMKNKKKPMWGKKDKHFTPKPENPVRFSACQEEHWLFPPFSQFYTEPAFCILYLRYYYTSFTVGQISFPIDKPHHTKMVSLDFL